MTIIYQYRVATTSLGGFLKLLKAWKGSVYKLLYMELVIFITMYATISLIYRFALTEDQRLFFETIVLDLYHSTSSIPLSFVLGFYVTFIVQRWWQQFSNVPWPDRTLFSMSAYLHGFDDRSRMMRRSVARYMMFGLIWICRGISVAVMKRFPTLDHIVEAGFITKEEKVMFENTECKYQKFFVPLMWANQILVLARRENKIDNDFGLRMVIEPLADFRDKCSLCFVYDWITVPLVYTQVVTFAVHSYFAVSLFGQQYLDPAKNYKGFELDFYVPGFTILQFLFYMGWLKVAEQMINPFGEDDDDFDINWLLDRHTAVAFALVDQCYGKYPTLVRDGFWNDVAPDIPYTESSARSMRPNFLGTTFNIPPSSNEHEKLLIRDHEEINQHEWLQRHRRRGSMSGSQLSLFPFRNVRLQGESQTTLASNGSGLGRYVSNGKVYYYVLGKDGAGTEGRTRWSSAEIPVTDTSSEDGEEAFQLRERANTDSDFRAMNHKERKLSLPFIFNPFSKNKQKKIEPTPTAGSPKTTRHRQHEAVTYCTNQDWFSVEPVKEPAVDTEVGSCNKSRRSGQANVPFQTAVSRVPMLSAISESCTITSMSQLLNPPSVVEIPDGDDVYDDNNSPFYASGTSESGICYLDETSPCLPKEETSTPSVTPSANSGTSPVKTPSSPPPIRTASMVTGQHGRSAQSTTAMDIAESRVSTASKSTTNSPASVKTPLSPNLKETKTTARVQAKLITTPASPKTNSPLKYAMKKRTEPTDIQQNNHNSPKSQSRTRKDLAPLIGFDDC